MTRTSARRLLAALGTLIAAAYVRVHVERRVTGPAPANGSPAVVAAGAPAWEPAFLARLANWVPEAPATQEDRMRGYLLAAPLTLAGLLVGLVSGVVPRIHAGTLLFEHARGPLAAYLRARHFAACTLGHVIIATGTPSPALLAHELVHVRQAERLGVLMAPLYLGLLIVYGYQANPLERAARLAQRRAQEAPV